MLQSYLMAVGTILTVSCLVVFGFTVRSVLILIPTIAALFVYGIIVI